MKEISLKNNLDKENSKLNCLISDRNTKIQAVTNDNEAIKCANTGNNNDNIYVNPSTKYEFSPNN